MARANRAALSTNMQPALVKDLLPSGNLRHATIGILSKKGNKIMAVRTILTLRPKPGQRQAAIEAFKRLDIFGHAIQVDGCLSVEMLESGNDSDSLYVTALWSDRAAIERWQTNRWRAEQTAELDNYLEPGPERALYDIILSTDER